jgi:hypothetical protein
VPSRAALRPLTRSAELNTPCHYSPAGESLCPDCQHMVRDVLQPLFDNKVADLMRLT